MPDPETEVIDQTQTDVTDTSDADKVDTDDAGDKKPSTETDDSGKNHAAAEYMQTLLDTYNVESPDELSDFIADLSNIKNALGDEDVQDLIDNKKLMLQYHAQWAAAEEEKKRSGETPEETIKRLEKVIKDKDNVVAQEKQREKERKENDRLISGFNSFVTKSVDGLKIADHLKDPLKRYLGVDNPIHDIDLSNKVGIKKLISEAGKMFEELEQTILKNARAKKEDIPPMSEEETSAASPGSSETKPKNIREARKQATAMLIQKLSRK